MPRSSMKFWVVWMVFSALVAFTASHYAFETPQAYSSVVDLLASIISILVGVSLAVSAMLASPISVAKSKVKDEFEAERITRVVSGDDQLFGSGQLVIFFIFITSLFLALVFKWVAVLQAEEFSTFAKYLAAISAFAGVFSLLWSIRLPIMLNSLAEQRRRLN